ncbi:MAG: excinuclease ABC subunit UvrA [Planctomycetes bacterium]|nr:excinuclease ABC subunit UvrA [Planctomycetota bacterium]
MPASDIVIRGAREHNLRNVDVVLPRNQLICLTGVSGSGKSSLAFDTLYAEGQRRYVESLSTFARQFLGQMPKPEVDHISGLSPSISISQKSSGNNPRSTVGTITEIYDFLRVLFARVGRGHCPQCGRPITAQTREQIIGRILTLPGGTHFSVLAPVIRGQKGEYRDLFEDLRKQGFVRARVDGRVVSLTDDLSLDRQMRHNIEVVVDRLTAGPAIRGRLSEAVDMALGMGKGNVVVAVSDQAPKENSISDFGFRISDLEGNEEIRNPKSEIRNQKKRREAGDIVLSSDFACTECGLSFAEPTPQLFSFNSPQGMCLTCDGLGEFFSFDPQRLVASPEMSFVQGAIELVGPWKDLGRWKRHIYRGVAETMERKLELAEGTLLETPWRDLTKKQRDIWLWGTGEEHITFTWRAGKAAQKYGGTFDGLIPELLEKYRVSRSPPQIRQLEQYMSVIRCPDCHGRRLNPQACAVTVTTASARFAESPGMTLPGVCALAVSEAGEFFADLQLEGNEKLIAAELLKEIRGRLGFLQNVGLEYLTLERTAPTLSGGESQRIRLAGQVGCGLVGVLYILDEPSIGLHPRDNQRLLNTLAELRDLGNTVVVVEHDEDTMRAADHLIDFGPGPGVRGGEVVAVGAADEIAKKSRSVTGAFLAGTRKIEVPSQRRLRISDCGLRIEKNGSERAGRRAPSAADGSAPSAALSHGGEDAPARSDNEVAKLRVMGARHNNLKNIDIEIPLGAFVCVTGASGSGKSSLVNDILAEALMRDLMGGKGQPGEHDHIEGLDRLDKLIVIDQSPIGRTPRSNPGTYIKLFDDIRSLYTQLPESKRRGYKPGRFSFNVQGGRCEACDGNGSNRLEMDFLADVWVTCPVCQGHRFNRETLQVMYKEKSIAQVLEMDVQEALAHFENIPSIYHKLSTLHAVGLDYIKIGQPSPTLSGGEAQRIKLARELVKKSTGRTLYLLDEPTTGLHFADIELLLKVLHDFVDAGNTVLVVEHNLDVVKTADWVIDIGPDGGAGGGRVVACGTPEELARCAESHTGRALAPVLGIGAKPQANGKAQKKGVAKKAKPAKEATHITVRGARQHNLRDLDLAIPRDAMTVFCGPSGSGKTSLAMDTIYAEGQRRYVESLSAYARQFVGQLQKPQVDHIDGLSPAIAIEQRNTGHTPRSTVGTVTEIYDYFRILFARLGQPHCPECDIPVGTQTSDQIVDKLLEEPTGTKLFVMAPVEVQVGEQYETLWESLRGAGYVRVRIDGETHSLDKTPTIDRRRKHAVEVVIDRIIVRPDGRSRIAGSIENALALGKGVVHVAHPDDDLPESRWLVRVHSQHLACEKCGRSFDTLGPHNFSFNSSLGWCPACEGLGTQVGANPAALLRDPGLTLAKGALLVWPEVSLTMSQQMLLALSAHTGVPIDVPYNDLSPRQKRTVLFGTGDDWIEVRVGESLRDSRIASRRDATTLFRFQYKGLYPALEEASKLSPRLRAMLEQFVGEIDCSECGGSRLRDDAAAVRFRSRTLDQIARTPLGELVAQVKKWRLAANEKKVAGELIREIEDRLTFLVEVGLNYLTLGRAAPTLSGGEAQRIRLASQVGSGLCGVLYVLDEPTIGLHPRDNTRLVAALQKLRDLGNTLIVVEHDREVVESADGLVDFGPGAGRLGGQIVASGTPQRVAREKNSVTGPYLSGKKAIGVPKKRRGEVYSKTHEKNDEARSTKHEGRANSSFVIRHSSFIEIIGARHNNLKNINVAIPLGTLTAVTGVSGSGKSSLVEDILYNQLARSLHRASTVPGAHEAIRGVEHINKVIRVDQQPLGNTPTSNPATYTGVFELIRQLFAQLPESKLRGYGPRRYSFNVPGGRCEACEGNGQKCIQMHFLPDIWVECDECRGQRYNPDVLEVRFHGKNIADVLDMSCGQAVELFANIPKIRRILQTLCDVGLDYLTLGQSAPTLSGGEAQRVKLAAELARPDTGQTLYLLDEPTTGLHFDDLAKLLEVLNRLVDQGNTVVVIEHNLDVIKTADWVIDLGPEAGADGGYVVAAGTPEEIVGQLRIADCGLRIKKGRKRVKSAIRNPQSAIVSHTAVALAPVLAAGPFVERTMYDAATEAAPRTDDLDIEAVGRDTRMPWELDGRGWHTRDRVARDGRDCKWDGRILDAVERRIHKLGEFAETNWNNRSIVEITASKKADGWFFHAITGERWLVKLKFRTAKKTFERDKLVSDLGLKPLNDVDEVEAYGRGPRVKCKNLRGPWQEVQIDAHSWQEIDTPAFWSFVERAVAGFQKFAQRVGTKPEDVMPWKVLGQKWHLSRKGFPPGKKTAWKPEVLEELLEMLDDAVPGGQFLWNNQNVVYLMVPGVRKPWATVFTKRLAGVDLVLNGPKGAFQLGSVAEMGAARALATDADDRDQVKLRFVTTDELHAENVAAFLKAHLDSLRGANVA